MENMVIDRNEWYRYTQEKSLDKCYGSSDYNAKLKLSGQEKYCCLGIWCRDVLGIAKDYLDNSIDPKSLFLPKDYLDLDNVIDPKSLFLNNLVSIEELDKIRELLLEHIHYDEVGLGEISYKNEVFDRLIMVNDRKSFMTYKGVSGMKELDWSGVTDSQQEELIRIGFREIGISVTFVG